MRPVVLPLVALTCLACGAIWLQTHNLFALLPLVNLAWPVAMWAYVRHR